VDREAGGPDPVVGFQVSKPVKGIKKFECPFGIDGADLSSIITVGADPETADVSIAIGKDGKVCDDGGTQTLIYSSRTHIWLGFMVVKSWMRTKSLGVIKAWKREIYVPIQVGRRCFDVLPMKKYDVVLHSALLLPEGIHPYSYIY
jgi:hypothetical protein